MCVCARVCVWLWWRVCGACVVVAVVVVLRMCVRALLCGGPRVVVRLWRWRWWWRRVRVCARLCGCGDVWRRVCGGACVAAAVAAACVCACVCVRARALVRAHAFVAMCGGACVAAAVAAACVCVCVFFLP